MHASAKARAWAGATVRGLGWLLLAVMLLRSSVAVANPSEGEARSTLRDADRVYTVVAGEGDGASTVTNPANLGFLRGINGILDVAFTRDRKLRRGSGAGAFLGLPLPFWKRAFLRGPPLVALGFGYQFLHPFQPDAGGSSDPAPGGIETSDEPYSKITFAFAIPLMRWVEGLTVGLGYSRLVSVRNEYADDVNQVDLALGYWLNRFLSLGLVARGLNQPRTGELEDVRQPLVLDPEVAFRPLGRPLLEVAAGARFTPLTVPGEARFHTPFIEPRGRLFVNLRGVRLFAEAELYRHNPRAAPGENLDPRNAVRIGAGVELNLPNFGVAGGVLLGANAGDSFAPHGGMGRLRFSQERYASLPVRPRRVTRIPLAAYKGERGMWKVVQLLEDLGERKAVVLVETHGMRYRWAQLEEVREALLRVRTRGGKVAAYMEGGGLQSYFLASAADIIIAHPTFGVDILGMELKTFYFGDLLARLGVRAEFVRIAEYKGTPEKYERNTATEPVATQRKLLLTDTWNHALRLIARERGHDAAAVSNWIDHAPYASPHAQRLGIVDRLRYPDELDEEMEQWLGKKVRIERPSRYETHNDTYGPLPRVAIVYIDGDLVGGTSATIPLIGRKLAGSNTITKAIEKVRKDRLVRAVVVRLNTGGGLVSASDAIARELDLTRKVKPVVISMGGACASGGYYIATGGQYILADATTVTGSIGIFRPKVDLSGLLEKFGVGIDQVGYGARSGLKSWWKPYSADERNTALRGIREDYEIFTKRVGDARAMTSEQVDSVARGRIWSGVRAVDVGLVDSYGGLREAILRARAIAGLRPDEGGVVEYPPRPGVLDQIRGLFGFRIPNPLSSQPVAGKWRATAAITLGIPAAFVTVLRHLPAGLWLSDTPESLYLAPESTIVQ